VSPISASAPSVYGVCVHVLHVATTLDASSWTCVNNTRWKRWNCRGRDVWLLQAVIGRLVGAGEWGKLVWSGSLYILLRHLIWSRQDCHTRMAWPIWLLSLSQWHDVEAVRIGISTRADRASTQLSRRQATTNYVGIIAFPCRSKHSLSDQTPSHWHWHTHARAHARAHTHTNVTWYFERRVNNACVYFFDASVNATLSWRLASTCLQLTVKERHANDNICKLTIR